MKRKFITTIGLISPLILAGCAGALLLASIGGWYLLKPEDQSRIIRIVPLAPLQTPPAEPPPQIIQVPAEAATPASGSAPVAAGESAAPAPAPASPIDAIAEVLGFSLPPGSVNSVIHEGVANRIIIPKLNLDSPVVLSPIKDQTWQVDHLGQAVGHLEGTAPPGSDSNIVLAGHVTLSAAVYGPFAGLGQLVAGDEVIVYEGETPFKYIVDSFQTVDRTAVDVTYPTNTGQITLITCNNWSNEEGRYTQRLIVKGHLVKN
jgi:LPXTG-site transpeptidase (sortase) family protein